MFAACERRTRLVFWSQPFVGHLLGHLKVKGPAMRPVFFCILALLVFLSTMAPSTTSGQDKSKGKTGSYQERLQSLLDDYRKENNKYEDEITAAKSEDDKFAIRKLRAQMANGFAEKFLAFAAEAPKTPPAADAMLWILRYADTFDGMEKVVDMVIKNQ